jgi:hypothetical protein
MTLRTLILLVGVLVALPAVAQDWYSGPDSTGRIVTSVGPGDRAYYDFAADTNPYLLDGTQSEYIVVSFNPDEDGTSTGDTLTLYDCDDKQDATTQYAAANCFPIRWVDVDGIVQTTLDGSAGRRKTGRIYLNGFLGIDVVWATNDARVLVRGY